MKRSLMIGAVLMLIGNSLPALAQPPGGGPGGGFQPPNFADFDENGDGKITQEEFDTFTQERMGAMGHGPGGGSGGFGGPGRPGGPGGPGGGPGGMFTNWDTNDDGVVTEEEFNARPRFRPGYAGPGGGRPPQQ